MVGQLFKKSRQERKKEKEREKERLVKRDTSVKVNIFEEKRMHDW